MKDIIYDYIVIGGGIGGLYANYLLSNKNYNGLLLEKNDVFGGRAYEMKFHGTLIKLGAGIIADNNIHLLKLLKELNIKVNKFKSHIDTYNIPDFDMEKAISNIIKKYNEHKNIIKIKRYTMKQFLLKYFGSSLTKNFIVNCEYYDFINSDVEYFIKYYDIHDMSHKLHDVLIINWIDLINKLVKNNCKNNVNVLRINKEDNIFNIKANNNNNNNNIIYYTKKIIFATTLKPLVKLSSSIINIIDIDYKNYIGAVPFTRIYCYYKNGYNTELDHFTIFDNKLQKVIKINNNVLMASYSDSSNALYWKKVEQFSKAKQISIVRKHLEKIGINNPIDDIVIAFWDEGVHYYKPVKDLKKNINKLSNPAKNVYVVGEMISYKQGWVEGAIESADRVINKL
jgi:hypothetical protein